MKNAKRRDGGTTLQLSKDEAQHLWCLIREGRKAIADNNDGYRSDFAMDVMYALPVTDMGFIQNKLKEWRREDEAAKAQ